MSNVPYTPKETATRQFAGLVLARVRARKLDELKVLLELIRDETLQTMRGHPPEQAVLPFHELETIHYARFALIDKEPAPWPMLAFSTNYDGPEGEGSCRASRALDHHIQELVTRAGPGLGKVFSLCEGYDSGLEAFIRKHQRPASTFYVGSSGRSRNQILWERDLRREVDRALDAGHFEKAPPEMVRNDISASLRSKYPKLPMFPPQPDLTGRVRQMQAVNFQPKLDKAFVLELARLDFVRRRDDLVITGKTGTGKSHILKAFALRACEQGIRMRYARCVDLLDDLHAGLADGSYPRRLKAWASPALLIIDDVGLGQVKKRGDEPTAAHTLYNLIDRRHSKVSTAVTSNIALSDWGRFLGDATLTAAILDRLAMHAIRIDIDGPSYRQHVAAERSGHRPATAPPPS